MLDMWVPKKVSIYFILQLNGEGGYLGYFEYPSLECPACELMMTSPKQFEASIIFQSNGS